MALQKLTPKFVERVWGTKVLEPWFINPNPSQVIGEVWYETPEVPILVKFLFTTDKLSVQVHPEDDYAAEHHKGSPGKTEMWHVLAAEPGATIAAGFRESVTPEKARESALSGDIENLLTWHKAAPGDTFFLKARTVHAIGAGLTICEIQQQSDITYRLYDYRRMGLDGKPRELHLEHGFTVAKLEPTEVRQPLPVVCPYFETSETSGISNTKQASLLIAIAGKGDVAGMPMQAGEVLLVPSNTPEQQASGDLRFLRALKP